MTGCSCGDCEYCIARKQGVDMVNHPPHYTKGRIDVLDFIEDQKFGYLDGQIIKYISRYRYKGQPLEDLRKAQFYLNRLIAAEENAGKI